MRRRDDWLSMSGAQRRTFTLHLVATYGPVCCICQLPIERDAAGWVDLSCQHVIPRSKGGLSTTRNCRPAHGRCNSQLGARPLSAAPVVFHHGLDLFER